MQNFSGAGDARSLWRQHLSGQLRPPADMQIAIAGSVTVEPLEPYLGAYLLARGFKAPHIVNGPFGQLFQVCRSYRDFFPGEPGVIALLWRVEDMFPDLLETPAALLDAVDEFAGAVRALREDFKGTLIVGVPPYPAVSSFDVTDLEQPLSGQRLYRRIVEKWSGHVAGLERVRLLDLAALEAKHGSDAARDPRKWLLYRQPWTERFWAALGRQLGRIIAAEKFSPKKCIVLDADNTLWGGVIGEDGMEGIALGEDFPGSAYRLFQKHVLHLKKKGILLAVASKNNEADFYEVLDNHDAMVLKRGDIAVFQVHWNSKVDSLREIARTLNIGLDALVFIDDSSKEIAEVRERLPEVTCIQVPEETANLPGLLLDSDLFDFAEITEEDRQRTEMILAEGKRKDLQGSLSESEFKASLGLEMTVFDAGKQHIARITQLVNKTNQFNLTTLRRTQNEIEQLAQSPLHRVIGMELKDKYGDYGLVGAAILEKKGEVCVIDTLLMSCRVLGRDAEASFMALFAEEAAKMGCTLLEGRYIPTPKNAMVKDLYRQRGMNYDPARDVWSIAPSALAPVPAHIHVKKGFDGNA